MSQDARPFVQTPQTTSEGPVSYAMLDQTLWAQFQSASDAEQFLKTWLALQCRQLGKGVQGLLVIGEVPDTGPFHPVATWPARDAPTAQMQDAIQQAMNTRSAVVLGEGESTRVLAQPLVVFDQLFGAVVVSVELTGVATPQLFRQLQWGAGWIEAVLRREQEVKDGDLRERVSVAFDMLATVLEQPKFKMACSALVTDLARRLDCERVTIGFAKRKRHKVVAMSHTAGFSKRANLVRDIALAMDEAADQRAVILWPEPEDWDFRVARAHADLGESYGGSTILTVPLQAEGEIVGALVFERPRNSPFTAPEIEACDAVASVVGPVLMDRRANDYWLPTKIFQSAVGLVKAIVGPAYFGAKLASLAVAGVVAFFWFAKTDHVVSSPARITGTVQRTIVAPFSGYLAAQYVSAGDLVQDGELLATLDDKDLTLERLRQVTAKQQRQSELDQALADRELAQVNIIRAQMAQAEAQLALTEEQLARTQIRAPFEGYIVEGDLRQSIGASLERGETLFRLSPLGAFRVILEVDERDLDDIAVGQSGSMRVSAMPETPLDYRVETITPLAQQSDGRNWFHVEATLISDVADLRPGMEGVARTDVDERLLISSLTGRLVDWVRLFVWRWAP